MDLQAAWSPLVAQALAEMAPGEKVGWLLNAVQAKQQDGTLSTAAQFTMWSPSPLVGSTLHRTILLADPFPTAEKVRELVAQGLRLMRDLGAEQIAGTQEP